MLKRLNQSAQNRKHRRLTNTLGPDCRPRAGLGLDEPHGDRLDMRDNSDGIFKDSTDGA